MLLFILGIIDIIGGVILALATGGYIGGSDFLFYLAVFFLLKGIWSLLTAMAGGFYFDLLGITDIVAAVSMFLITAGVVSGVFLWIGVILILKGIYSAAVGIPVS